METIEIKNLQAPEIEELDDSELIGVVGGGLQTWLKKELNNIKKVAEKLRLGGE